ncbi:bestrophin-like domain [Streptomyces hypolithicus]
MSQWLVLSLAMAAACAVVLTITVINHRRIGEDDDPSETPDVIEYMTMMIGVVYAIVLGLAIAGVWEGRSSAQESVRQEAQALHEVSARAEVYPAEVRTRIRDDVDAYVAYVVIDEWRYMSDHETLSERGTALLDQVRRDVTDYVPRNDHEGQAYQPLVDQVAAADDARGARGQNAGATMPGVVWFGLITGALVAVGLIFTLQIRRTARELLLAGLYSALIAFLLFLIWDFDAPFGRGISATASPFLDLFPDAAR